MPNAAAYSLSPPPNGALPEDFRATLTAAVEACEILSSSSYRFADLDPIFLPPATPDRGGNGVGGWSGGGAAAQTTTPPVPGFLTPWAATATGKTEKDVAEKGAPDADAPLTQALTSIFYAYAYARPGAIAQGVRSVAGHVAGNAMAHADPVHVAVVASATTTVTRWDAGWMIYKMEANGAVHLRKGDAYRLAQPGGYQIDSPGTTARVGGYVSLPTRSFDDQMQPGFVYLPGQNMMSDHDAPDLVRIYFHLSPEGAAPLVRALTGTLNRYEAPFTMKLLANPRAYDRADSCVLYFAKRYARICLTLVGEMMARPEAAAFRLRPTPPLFTLRIADGVGVAEDPATGESFGQSRCRLLAQGLVDAWRSGARSTSDRLNAVDRRFALEGASLKTPYLRAGNIDCFKPSLAAARGDVETRGDAET